MEGEELCLFKSDIEIKTEPDDYEFESNETSSETVTEPSAVCNDESTLPYDSYDHVTIKEEDLENPPEPDYDEIGEFCFESDHVALKSNNDYKKLLEAIFILEAQKAQAIKDLDELYKLRDQALADPIAFVEKLQNGNVNFSAPTKVHQLPVIDWSKYILSTNSSLGRRQQTRHAAKVPDFTKFGKSDVQQEENKELKKMMGITSIVIEKNPHEEPPKEMLLESKKVGQKKRKLNDLKMTKIKAQEKQLMDLTPLFDRNSSPIFEDSQILEPSSSLSLSTLEPEAFNNNENYNLKQRILELEAENKELKRKNMLLEKELDDIKASDVTVAAEKLAFRALQETFTRMKATGGKNENDKIFTVTDNDNDDNDKVELAKGTGVFIKKNDKQLALAFSHMDVHAAQEKAASYGTDVRRRENKLPPLLTINKELYTGPYDPLKLIKYLLRLLFSPEQLAKFSANGKRASSGGNEGIPRKELEAVLAFTHKYCPKVCISTKHINDAVNSVCCYARKKLTKEKKPQTKGKDMKEEMEELEEMTTDDEIDM